MRHSRQSISALLVMLAITTVMILTPLAGVRDAWADTAPTGADRCQRIGTMMASVDREAMAARFSARLKDKLGLTDQQVADIRASFDSRRDAQLQGARALCEARVALRTLQASQTSDPAAVRAAGEQLKAAQGQMLDLRLATYLDLRGKLTPDQWAAWVELRKAMGARGHWRHHGPQPPQQPS
jgi:Spy/CpxP family protein refolding chaperone